MDFIDFHTFIYCLAHIINGKQCYIYTSQCFHFYARLTCRFCRTSDLNLTGLIVTDKFHFYFTEVQDMAQRNQL